MNINGMPTPFVGYNQAERNLRPTPNANQTLIQTLNDMEPELRSSAALFKNLAYSFTFVGVCFGSFERIFLQNENLVLAKFSCKVITAIGLGYAAFCILNAWKDERLIKTNKAIVRSLR